MNDEQKPEIAELRGPAGGFPIDTMLKPKPLGGRRIHLSAYDIAQRTSKDFTFGMDSKVCAAKLREIAAAIESGDFLLQAGGVYTQSRRDDYPMTVLNLKFYEKEDSGGSNEAA